MLRNNYHTHTKRCGHAEGEDEDYVLEALGSGITDLGFSDHIMLPGFSQPNVRGEYSVLDDYLESIDNLKQKYKDRMHIHVGFEAESISEYFPYYRELIESGTIDYLILGNHFSLGSDHQIKTYFAHTPTSESIREYRDRAIEALKTGLFSCFAHPDYYMSAMPKITKEAIKIAKELIQTAMELDIPLEVNVAGIRNGKKNVGNTLRYIYPTDAFFELAGKMKAKCIIGIDAHSPRDISDDDSNSLAVRFAKKHNLNLIARLEFKGRNKK